MNKRFLGISALILLINLSLAGSGAFARNDSRQSFSVTTLGLAQDPLLVRALYAVPSRMAGSVDPDGAVGVNRGVSSQAKFFIEEQRYGGDLVQTGLASNDDTLIKTGLKVINWGFSRQGADGSFPGTGDPFHSVSLFVEGTARALLSLSEANRDKYGEPITALVPKLFAAAQWLEQPEVERRGQSNNFPYTHRRWVLAAALAETAALAHDPNMAAKAKAYADQGLALQQADGVNPEKDGYDVSYQAVGILEAERYLVVCHDQTEQTQVKGMIEKACNWEIAMIGDDGQVNVGNSTRMGNEAAHSGKIKHVNTKEVLQALTYASKITGDERYRNRASLVARAHGWLQ